jgi:hypothetical protein
MKEGLGDHILLLRLFQVFVTAAAAVVALLSSPRS